MRTFSASIQTQLDAVEQETDESLQLLFANGTFIEVGISSREEIPCNASLQEVSFGVSIPMDTLTTQFVDELLPGACCAIISTFRTTSDVITLFGGEIDSAKMRNDGIDLDVIGIEHELLEEIPPRTFSRECDYRLYDTWCTVNRASFVVTGTVQTVDTTYIMADALLGITADWFQLGAVWFPGHPNGIPHGVRSSTVSGRINFMSALRPAPLVGATFEIYPGCDKTFATCDDKYEVGVNFGGFRFIPRPESLTGLR